MPQIRSKFIISFFLLAIPPVMEAVLTAPDPHVVNETGGVQWVKGIVLVPGEADIKEVPREEGISVFLRGDYASLKLELKRYLGLPLSGTIAREVKKAIVHYFEKVKHEYVVIIVPLQEVTDGIMIIQVLTGKVGDVLFLGQRWFSPRTLNRFMQVKRGDPIIETQLIDRLTFLNRNPFISAKMILSPGKKKKGTTDVEFIVKDRFPVRFYVGVDNLGYRTNGEYQLYGGMNCGNMFLLGDIFSYQYTSSTDFDRFQSHLVTYTSFLPWQHLLSVFGAYAIVYPTITDFAVKGEVVQGSVRYRAPLKPLYTPVQSYLEGGFDFKYISSNSLFVGNPAEAPTPISSTPAIDIGQFLLSGGVRKTWIQKVLSLQGKLVVSPLRNWLPNQTNSAYDALRGGSRPIYGYGQISLRGEYLTRKEWGITGRARYQQAVNTLPTSEQFGLGGMNTVRGYNEQQFVADNAVCINVEIYTPPLSFYKKKGIQDELSFLSFFDFGYGYNYSFVASEFEQQHLMGVGPGLRYEISPYLRFKLDYGFQLKAVPGDDRWGRLHLSGSASY